MTCPNLKNLDLRKITPEMREAGGVVKPGDSKVKVTEDSSHKSDTVSTDISPDKINLLGGSQQTQQ